MNKQVNINPNKCIGCGLCVKDCVAFDLELVNKKASRKNEGCIYCGHCESICPQNAIQLTGFEDEIIEFEKQTRLDPDTLLKAIQTRRTIRNFTDKKIDKEIIDMIIEAGRLAPTGSNSQKTSFIVLDKKKDECEKIAVSLFSNLIKTGRKVIPFLKNMNIDENFFFKKAPIVIVVLGEDKVSASLAAQNMAFMAEANGLGVLFSGFFTMCYNFNSKIRKAIGTSKNPKAITTLVLGYPMFEYHRSAHRNKANVIHS